MPKKNVCKLTCIFCQSARICLLADRVVSVRCAPPIVRSVTFSLSFIFKHVSDTEQGEDSDQSEQSDDEGDEDNIDETGAYVPPKLNVNRQLFLCSSNFDENELTFVLAGHSLRL